jgi:hypothetical protein
MPCNDPATFEEQTTFLETLLSADCARMQLGAFHSGELREVADALVAF